MLGEGVNIAGKRGVEAACLADTRGSQAEIAQNIDLPLRPNREGAATTVRTLVPVLLQPGEAFLVWGEYGARARAGLGLLPRTTRSLGWSPAWEQGLRRERYP